MPQFTTENIQEIVSEFSGVDLMQTTITKKNLPSFSTTALQWLGYVRALNTAKKSSVIEATLLKSSC